MSYTLSAAKLQTYHRCPRAYYFRYERRLDGSGFYGSTALGTSLHQALAQIYQDWHYQDPVPRLDWIEYCWNQQIGDLTSNQIAEGRAILRRYYYSFIASQSAMRRPLAVEGRIQGCLQVENLEFVLSGRYDRLDYCGDGLELIDYKSAKEIETIEPDEIDLQIGLYYLALEQRYQRSLKQLSLLYLRTGEKFSYTATPGHRQRVEQVISELAVELRRDRRWLPVPGTQCDRCAYARYCPAMRQEPEPLPEAARPEPGLQLVLSLN
ncbi:PD-(D/E)XK nuclease family protein [Leptolyngbya sp. NK1-12]|uniref:PD-(D/E)XK nuclease family protein n=1 Tax=Leptolyngbya sp. NK1-12 TaxID=2547451 RepID=A0AA96WFP7_9CYAN|nr:PD-(D/E)XK nuclease family protein [Leptolyngbya sp. NK1-12]WNZ24204.1 PD-(D/E)XK nuclease family protein [Leptolyngbya sp. NK1-12]